MVLEQGRKSISVAGQLSLRDGEFPERSVEGLVASFNALISESPPMASILGRVIWERLEELEFLGFVESVLDTPKFRNDL